MLTAMLLLCVDTCSAACNFPLIFTMAREVMQLYALMICSLIVFITGLRMVSRVQLRKMLKMSGCSDSTENTGLVLPETMIPISIKDDTRPLVSWQASARASVRVTENKRTAEQYMALPASQYSVLSAEQVLRLSDSDFKITLGTLNFFGTKLVPILYVTVNVFPDLAKAEIIVDKAEIEGGDVAKTINGSFDISAINIVSAGTDDKGRKTLNSDTKLKINTRVPSTKFPLGVIQNGGNFIMQSSLNVIVPTFIRILAADFKRWSGGDDKRTAVEGARLDLQ